MVIIISLPSNYRLKVWVLSGGGGGREERIKGGKRDEGEGEGRGGKGEEGGEGGEEADTPRTRMTFSLLTVLPRQIGDN